MLSGLSFLLERRLFHLEKAPLKKELNAEVKNKGQY
jgi:hypothetical protein